MLSRSDARGEREWARAILLALQGWASVKLAEAFGVTTGRGSALAGVVQRERGVDARRSSLAPGSSPAKGERALVVVSGPLRQPIEDHTNWTLPRLQAEIERQTGASISAGRLSVLLKKVGEAAGGGPATR